MEQTSGALAAGPVGVVGGKSRLIEVSLQITPKSSDLRSRREGGKYIEVRLWRVTDRERKSAQTMQVYGAARSRQYTVQN